MKQEIKMKMFLFGVFAVMVIACFFFMADGAMQFSASISVDYSSLNDAVQIVASK